MVTFWGSSTLTRGERLGGLRRVPGVGLIPTHAGKTPDAPSATFVNAGSSPLTRGKLSNFPCRPAEDGLIPTHAGKTSSFSWLLRRSAAHPRSCGENGRRRGRRLGVPGSSPLTRGKRRSQCRCTDESRLIPAHAGKTDGASGERDRFPAHPRSRGENGSWVSRRRAVRGSSPLTRGKQLVIDYLNRPGGLIPAHAGKTSTRGNCPSATWAHPRSRGENTGGGGLGSHDLGSSPLTRGKQYRRVLRGNVPGLIPAHAGKTYHGTRTR